MKKQIRIDIDVRTAQYLLDILNEHQSGYSSEFTPERIVKIREFIDKLKESF